MAWRWCRPRTGPSNPAASTRSRAGRYPPRRGAARCRRHLCFALVIRGNGDQDSAAAYALGVVMRILVRTPRRVRPLGRPHRAQARPGKRCGDGAGGDDRADARDREWRERERRPATPPIAAPVPAPASAPEATSRLRAVCRPGSTCFSFAMKPIRRLDTLATRSSHHVLRLAHVVEQPDHRLRHLLLALNYVERCAPASTTACSSRARPLRGGVICTSRRRSRTSSLRIHCRCTVTTSSYTGMTAHRLPRAAALGSDLAYATCSMSTSSCNIGSSITFHPLAHDLAHVHPPVSTSRAIPSSRARE